MEKEKKESKPLIENYNLRKLVSGGLAGGVATAVTIPLDTFANIAGSNNKNTKEIFKTLKTEALENFVAKFKRMPTSKLELIRAYTSRMYKGVTPKVLKVVPLMGLTFAAQKFFDNTLSGRGNKAPSLEKKAGEKEMTKSEVIMEKIASSYEQMVKFVHSPYKNLVKVTPKAIVVQKANNAVDNALVDNQIIKYLKDKFLLTQKNTSKAAILKRPEAKKLEQKFIQTDDAAYVPIGNITSYKGNRGGLSDRVRNKSQKNINYTSYNV